MGKGNAAVKQWLSKRKRFADLFNAVVFQGEQIVLPEDLEPVETESDILVEDKSGKTKEVQRHRDIVMRWKKNIHLVMLACENQEKIHYAMPVRTMLYDGLSYTEQIQRLHELRKEELGKKLTQDEFLSRFCKDDKIYPVITLVLYYGEKEWDGSTDLYGMFQLENVIEQNQLLQQYIPNYRINLVEPGKMKSFEKFQTDLQEIFGMLKYKNDKKELLNYVNQREAYFQNVDAETYYVIREFLHSEKVLKEINKKAREEKLNMCKALQDLYDEGIEKGKLDAAKNFLKFLDPETVAENVELPLEVILKLKEEG